MFFGPSPFCGCKSVTRQGTWFTCIVFFEGFFQVFYPCFRPLSLWSRFATLGASNALTPPSRPTTSTSRWGSGPATNREEIRYRSNLSESPLFGARSFGSGLRSCLCLHLEIVAYQYNPPPSSSLQYWMLSKEGEIRRDEACLDYAGSDVILYPCHGSRGNQFWMYNHEVKKKFI